MSFDPIGVAARLPAQDLERAQRWYAEKLDLHPVETRAGGLRYLIGDGEFSIFQSAGRSDGAFTQLAITVTDIESAVATLRGRGVHFEEYDQPPLSTRGGVAEIAGNYPSRGIGERGAWFRDCEGNMIGLGQPVKG